jgi:DNA-binding NarL/FixJ family response regulator
MIRVLIVAKVRFYRDGLAVALARSGSIAVVGQLGSWTEALPLIGARRPEIILLDADPDERLDAIRRLAGAAARPRVVALCIREHETSVLPLAEAGVSGFVSYDHSLDQLIDVIASIARGELPCSPRTAAVLLRHITCLAQRDAPAAPRDLTRRELEILDLIDLGLSNREIARRLYIEHSTVKNHVHNILEKLDVARRADAVARAKGQVAVEAREAVTP